MGKRHHRHGGGGAAAAGPAAAAEDDVADMPTEPLEAAPEAEDNGDVDLGERVERRKDRKRRKLEKLAKAATAPADAADGPEAEPNTAVEPPATNGPAAAATTAAEGEGDGDCQEAQSRRVAKGKAKKAAKKAAKAAALVPQIDWPPPEQWGVLKVSDLRDLALWTLADGVNVKFIILRHAHLIQHVVYLMVSGLSPDLLDSHGDCLPALQAIFGDAIPMAAPGERTKVFSPTQALLQCPLPKELKQARAAAAEAVAAASKVTPEALLVDSFRLRENNYPMLDDDGSLPPGFVTLDGDRGAATVRRGTLFAIDCEMCQTTEGLELARVSVVGEDMDVVYNSYVLPRAPIVDYNTKYSGITAEKLQNITTRLEDVQYHLRQLLPKDAILVGHSLENDLRVLKIYHTRVIDTALVYDHTRGKPFKPALRWLASNFLDRQIQTGEQGHDSIEDAKAAMALVKLKLERGLAFGEQQHGSESLFVRLQRNHRTSAMVDTASVVSAHARPPTAAYTATSDYEAIQQTLAAAAERHFVLARLTALEQYYKSLEAPDAPAKPDRAHLRTLLTQVDGQVKKLYESLPPRTLLVVFSGHGDMVEARRWMARQDRAKKAPKGSKEATWTEADQQSLENAIMYGRRGVSFFALTPDKPPATADADAGAPTG